eukprot:CAMPEP_0196757752 /NCGR_PEP_ID=MMETSP1091-20130531/103828_1 /TAXON_ID=302021 /ORGANISM="Rhodomonas sp., Strain CCMP768" /LENGTH=41 /DNA_ID= /DNA_START= /DNA_END= /DNA_ORIENTATION=
MEGPSPPASSPPLTRCHDRPRRALATAAGLVAVAEREAGLH